jgi:hypothetical protein
MVRASAANAIDAVDISKPQFKANPYPFYAKLRAEQPVFPVKLPDGQTAWLITRYDDALRALKDRRFSKDKLNAGQKQPWTPAFFKHVRVIAQILKMWSRNHLPLSPCGSTHPRLTQTTRIWQRVWVFAQNRASRTLSVPRGSSRRIILNMNCQRRDSNAPRRKPKR